MHSRHTRKPASSQQEAGSPLSRGVVHDNQVPTNSNWVIDFGTYSLPAPKYKDVGTTRYQVGKIRRRGGVIINNGYETAILLSYEDRVIGYEAAILEGSSDRHEPTIFFCHDNKRAAKDPYIQP